MIFFTTTKLGPKQQLTPEGFLLCLDVPIARTGIQKYLPEEVDMEGGADGLVYVERPESEVFRKETVASAQGKPVTKDHPPMPEDPTVWTVRPSNFGQYSVGVTMNPRRGSGEQHDILVADLLICDQNAIEAVRERELAEISCGYSCDYDDVEPGKARQINIIINHVALVGLGRCGPQCTIQDEQPTCRCNGEGGSTVRVFKDIKDKVRKAMKAHDDAGVEKALEEVKDEVPVDQTESGDVHKRLESLEAGHAAHAELHKSHDHRLKAHDAQLASHEQKIEELHKGPEGEEVTDDEMKPEIAYAQHDRIRQVKDSSLLHDSYQGVVAGAEIIKPGITIFNFDRAAAPGKTYKAICDLRRQALTHAMTSDAVLLTEVRGNRPLDSSELSGMPCQQVKTVFDSLVALKKRVNNSSTNGSNASSINGNNTNKRPPKSLADLNVEAAKVWKDRT